MKKFIVSILAFLFLLTLFGCTDESESLGIIGGADGPTAIVVSGGFSVVNISVISILLVIALISVIAVMLWINRQK